MPEISSRSDFPEWSQAANDINRNLPHLGAKEQSKDDAVSQLALQYMHLYVLEQTADDPQPIQHHKTQHVKLDEGKAGGFKEKFFNLINKIHNFVKNIKLFWSESKNVQVKSPEVMVKLSPEKVAIPKKEEAEENKVPIKQESVALKAEIIKEESKVDHKDENDEDSSSSLVEDSQLEISQSFSDNKEEVSSSRRSTIIEPEESVSKSYVESASPRSESPTPELQSRPASLEQESVKPESSPLSPKLNEELKQSPPSQPKASSKPKFEEPILFTSEDNDPGKIKRLNEAVEKLKTLANSAKDGVQKEVASTFKEKCGSVFAGMWMKLTGSFDIKSWKQDSQNPDTYILQFNKLPTAFNLGVLSLKINVGTELRVKFVKERNKVGVQIENLSLAPGYLDKKAGVKEGPLKSIFLDSHGHIEMPGSVESKKPISIKSLK